MSAKKSTGLLSFAAAFGTLGVAAVLTRACPGGCASCTTCATQLVPMATGAGAVGLAFAGSAWSKRRGLKRAPRGRRI